MKTPKAPETQADQVTSVSMREAKSAADKLGPFIDVLTRAKLVLEGASQAEQQTAELRAAIVSAERGVIDARAREVDAKEALAKAVEAVRLATANGAEIEENARQRAAAIVSEAGKAAAAIERTANELSENAKALDANARADVAAAKAEVEAARTELTAINVRIEAAKAAARQTFGG